MIKSPTSTLTIVFLILMKNVQHWSTHAAKEVVNLDTLYDDKMHHLAKRMDLQVCLGESKYMSEKNIYIREKCY